MAAGMKLIEGGSFRMGSDRHYPDEAPVRTVEVESFWIEEMPVTNADFANFVKATGHVTTAEIAPTIEQYQMADPALLHPGSAVFTPTPHAVDLGDPSQWWTFTLAANWRAPEGTGSDIRERMDHPVVHVSFQDALAYARWCGRALPNESQWEYAARGGLDGAVYAWGEDLAPAGAMMANYWQGRFPYDRRPLHGFARTSPVGHFPPNGYGLSDMIGNVWEWTVDEYQARAVVASPCCTASALRSGRPRVIKGGSFLCAENYCRRYRPAARHAQDVDTSTSHVGFRCVRLVM